MEGKHSNMLIRAVWNTLRSGKNHVFAEWHIGVDLGVVPLIEQAVRVMRPDVDYQAFTILRHPISHLVSNAVYWETTLPVDMRIMRHNEFLLFEVLQVPATMGRPGNDTAMLCREQPKACTTFTRYLVQLLHEHRSNSSLHVPLRASTGDHRRSEPDAMEEMLRAPARFQEDLKRKKAEREL